RRALRKPLQLRRRAPRHPPRAENVQVITAGHSRTFVKVPTWLPQGAFQQNQQDASSWSRSPAEITRTPALWSRSPAETSWTPAPWSRSLASRSWISYPLGSFPGLPRRVAAAAAARPPWKSSAFAILPRIASLRLLIGLAISYPASATGF